MQNLFGFIIHPMELGVIWLSSLVGSAGIGIILFTILVRLILSPLQIIQLRSARAMQRIQPLIRELQQKHGKDRKALSEATMALYKEHNVNPAMGCLPTLLQFPILIGLFYAFMSLGNSIPLKFPTKGSGTVHCSGHLITTAQSWYDTCYRVTGAVSNPDHIYSLFHAHFLWLSNGLGQHDPLFILPLLAGATQWIQTRMLMPTTPPTDPNQKMMNNMMNFMPLMIIFFATRYASGLSLYWVTSTVIAIAIQYQITGWGLVPRPAMLLARFRGAPTRQTGAKTAGRAGKPAAPRSPAAKRETPPSRPALEAADVVPLNRAEMDGQDGQNGGGQSPPQAAPREVRRNGAVPRKRANRASRGGRGGGRRG